MKIKNVVAKRLEKYQETPNVLFGVIGDISTGNIEVPGRTSMIYVTLFSGIVIDNVLNVRVPNLLGQQVRIGHDPLNLPGTLQVLGVRDTYYGDVDNPGTGPVWHRKQHEWPAGDTVYTWGEQFLPSLYYPIAGTLTVSIYPGVCYLSTGWAVRTQKTTVSLAASVASITVGHARFALIVIDSNGDLVVRDGDLVAEQADPFISAYMMLTPADIPAPAAGDSAICAVKLFYGQTELRCNGNVNDFVDLRFSGAGISGGGGGGAHIIQEEGTSLTLRAKLNFIGSGVTAEDDVANNATKVTVAEVPTSPIPIRAAVFTFEGLLTVASGVVRIYNKLGVVAIISQVYLTVTTPPTGAAIIVDVHKDGTTIFTNQAHRPQIAASANTGYSTDIDVGSWADGSYLSVDIDQGGSTFAGADLTVHVIATFNFPAGAGGGDMTQAIYDTDEDGIVDKAEMLDDGAGHTATATATEDAVTKKHTQNTDTALGTVGTKNPPVDADKALYRNSAASDVLVTSTWTQIKAFLKTYFDTLYLAKDTRSQVQIGESQVIDDDTVYSFSPPAANGIIVVFGAILASSVYFLMANFRVTGTAVMTAMNIGADVVVGTGVLTDGTGDGTDTKLNVHAHTDGKIYIKNRTGTSRTYVIKVM